MSMLCPSEATFASAGHFALMSAPIKEPAETPIGSIGSLHALAEAEGDCRRCPLYRDATQAVPGEGPSRAEFMLVGEQPGDKEDLAGKPFVGPAGHILDAALKDAGIPREDTFVTNAVKHFKHEMRGKRRLHKRPNNYEIERCKIWLDRERELVRPSTIIALGVTAARSLTGKTVTIAKMRKTPVDMADRTKLVVTVHPSALLRIEDENDRHAAYKDFVADLKAAAEAAKIAVKPGEKVVAGKR
jgi:uracil-DNA glycosylase